MVLKSFHHLNQQFHFYCANLHPYLLSMELKPRISYFGQFCILVGLVGAGIVIGSLIALLVFCNMTGVALTDMMEPEAMKRIILNPAYKNALIVLQLISTFFGFFVPAQAFTAIVSRKSIPHLGFNTKANVQQVGLVILMVLAGLFLVSTLGELTKLIPISDSLRASFEKMEADYAEQIKAMATMKNTSDYILALVVIALAPALFEEVLFRGALQQLFVRWFRQPHVAIILTSLIFSAVHFSYYGFVARFALGMVLGYMFYYSKNIWLNTLAHFINNAIAVTALYFITKAGKPITTESLEDNYPLWSGAVALIVIVYALIIFKKQSAVPASQTETGGLLLTNDFTNYFKKNNDNFPEMHNPK